VKKIIKRRHRKIIDSFCGLPSESDRLECDKIHPLGAVIERHLHQFHRSNESLHLLKTLWPSVVGKKLSCYTKVTGISAETVSVTVANGTVRQELALNRINFLKAIQRIPGFYQIRKLRLIACI
jgi:hypothetical protein